MMDEETITKLQLERDRVEVIRKYEQEQTLKSFYDTSKGGTSETKQT
jgi:hypothetical protein